MFELHLDSSWERIEKESFEHQMQKPLQSYIKERRWFGAKNRSIIEIKISECIKLNLFEEIFYMLLIELFYSEAVSETYLLPIAFAQHQPTHGIIAKVLFKNREGFLYEAVFNEKFRLGILDLIQQNKIISTNSGNLIAARGEKFQLFLKDNEQPANSRITQSEQSNTSFFYDDIFFFKLYRRLQEGLNPDVELTKYLTEKTEFEKLPAFAGSIELQHENIEPKTIGLLQKYIINKGDAWDYFDQAVKQFFNNALSRSRYVQSEDLLDPAFIENVTLLGKRTSQLHIALSGDSEDKDFKAEPVSMEYQEFLYESMKSLAHKVFKELNFENSYQVIKDDVAKLISIKDNIFERIEEIKKRNFTGQLIRIHGDYHLGQVLFTGNDFIISDFEGEPAREITQRRQKHLALKDLAGMLRSFYYVAYSPIFLNGLTDRADIETLNYWAQVLYEYLSEKFLISYIINSEKAEFLPKTSDETEFLLSFYMLEKAIYELNYELNNRPGWIIIPAKGIWQIMMKKVEINQI
ncbi:MAG TPA: hypothetical protein DDX75_14270 [Phycisphaerales bacterium]|nr:hypothetical protein [Phycisphaerales bacterium]